MEDCSCNNQCNSVAKCDIFDFMAKHVGMTVIHPGGFASMMKDEGFFRTVSIMLNIMKNKEIKNRVKIMNHFFRENNDVFGCGIYYFKK